MKPSADGAFNKKSFSRLGFEIYGLLHLGS